MYLLRGLTKKISKFITKGNQFNIKPIYKIESGFQPDQRFQKLSTAPYLFTSYHKVPDFHHIETSTAGSQIESLRFLFKDKLYTSASNLIFFKVLKSNIKSGAEIIKPILGCATQEHKQGVRILFIAKDSIASQSDLEVGDILTEVNGIRHKAIKGLHKTLSDMINHRSEVIMTVIRNNLIKHIKLVV